MSDKIVFLRSISRFVLLVFLLLSMVWISFTKSIGHASLMNTPKASADNLNSLQSDVNGDGVVDILDLTVVAIAWNSRPQDPKWNPKLDLNADGVVSILDMVLLLKDFGRVSIDRAHHLTKAIALYARNPPLSDADLQHLVKYDFISIGLRLESEVGRIKALNPSAKVFLYMDCIYQSDTADNPVWTFITNLPPEKAEPMFLHDTRGNTSEYRIKDIDSRTSDYPYTKYVMDITNTDYRNLVASYLNQRSPLWDGIFLDNTWQYCYYDQLQTPEEYLPKINEHIKPAVISWLQFLKSVLASKLLVCNVPSALDQPAYQPYVSSKYWDYIDGIACEGWIKAWWGRHDWEDARPEEIIAELQAVKNQTAKGKWFIGENSDVTATLLETDLAEFQKFFYACHLVASSNLDRTGIAWVKGTINTTESTYFPLMDLEVGRPLGDMVISGSVVTREFENVHVQIDLSTHIATIAER